MIPAPPRTEAELISRAEALAGSTLGDIALRLGRDTPASTRRAKGWTGELIEVALGATAASRPEPDFQLIGVELKTVPVRADGLPAESTYVCTVPLDGDADVRWEASNVRRKLARVLWMPIEADPSVPPAARRVGMPLLWSPDAEEDDALRGDWEDFMDRICVGRIDEITAREGRFLQIRPKAANARARRMAVGEDGARVPTLPRGYYLRTSFTAALFAKHFA